MFVLFGGINHTYLLYKILTNLFTKGKIYVITIIETVGIELIHT